MENAKQWLLDLSNTIGEGAMHNREQLNGVGEYVLLTFSFLFQRRQYEFRDANMSSETPIFLFIGQSHDWSPASWLVQQFWLEIASYIC